MPRYHTMPVEITTFPGVLVLNLQIQYHQHMGILWAHTGAIGLIKLEKRASPNLLPEIEKWRKIHIGHPWMGALSLPL